MNMKKFLKIFKYETFNAFLIFLLMFAVLFITLVQGVGQYWDWNFPYFQDDIKYFFETNSSVWTQLDLGKPLSYSSDYFFRFIISKFDFLEPEYILYSLIITIFASVATIIYKTIRSNTKLNIFNAYLLSSATLLNPAIFYKLNAGHINYLVAFVFFALLIYFLLCRYKRNYQSNLIVGLIIGASAIQIQFLVFSVFFLLTYVIFNTYKIHIKSLVLIVLMPILVNLVWITNFITGANSAANLSAKAGEVTVASSRATELSSVFNLEFSSATQLTKYFSNIELVILGGIFVVFILILILVKKQNTSTIIFNVNLLTYIFLSTGLIFVGNLQALNFIAPVFREVGHYGPLIILFIILSISFNLQHLNIKLAKVFSLFIFVFILITSIHFLNFKQAINFESIRNTFQNYNDNPNVKQSDSRILAYPFFDQYNLLGVDQPRVDGFPIANTGHDSFLRYSGSDFINNAVAPKDFKNSIQYRFLQNYDVSILDQYNIRYIYDFSKIYQSNYEKYVPKEVYDNDLSIIKNDPDFMKKVLSANPGRVKLIDKNIIEVIGTESRLSLSSNILKVSENDNIDYLGKFYKDISDSSLSYTTTKINTNIGSLFPLTEGYDLELGKDKHINSSTFTNKHFTNLYRNSGTILSYTFLNGELTVYSKAIKLEIGDREVDNITSKILYSKIIGNSDIYLEFNGIKVALNEGEDTQLGYTKNSQIPIYINGRASDMVFVNQPAPSVVKEVEIVTSDKYILSGAKSSNLIPEDAVEKIVEKNGVSDCNEYDSNGIINGKLDTTDYISGLSSLVLSASRHDACSSIEINNIIGNTQYEMYFNTKVLKGNNYGFYIEFNDENRSSVSNVKKEETKEWKSSNISFRSPKTATKMRIYFYAYEQSDMQEAIVKYDAIKLYQSPDISNLYMYMDSTTPQTTAKLNLKDDKDIYKAIEIKNAKNIIYLKFLESYNGLWDLRLGDKSVGRHFELNNYANAWEVNTQELCDNNSLCIKQGDGSYNYTLSLVFIGGPYFNLGLAISSVTIISVPMYLVISKIRRRW